MIISKELFTFLKDLDKHNNRDWFNERKDIFKVHEVNVKEFFAFIESQLNTTDTIESHSVYRIYRDVRFSKDKIPYNPRFAGSFKRAKPHLRGGYFLNIQPGKSIVGGGFYGPNKEDLLRIRKEFELSDTTIRKILNDKQFKAMFGGIRGSELATAPRGFDKEHPAIDLIRKKQFIVLREFTDEEVMSQNFVAEVLKTYDVIRPYFDYMTEVLTSNLNGERVL